MHGIHTYILSCGHSGRLFMLHLYGKYISSATYTNLIILTRTDKIEQSQVGEEKVKYAEVVTTNPLSHW